MEECRIEELLREIDRYRLAIQAAQEALVAAEMELEAYLVKRHEKTQKVKGQEPRDTPSGVWYDCEHGCYNDAYGRWLVTVD